MTAIGRGCRIKSYPRPIRGAGREARKCGINSLQDCLALCDLTPDEVAAIGEHGHVPEIIASSLGSYLIHRAHGAERVRDMIVDDMGLLFVGTTSPRGASVLRTFLHEHPEAAFKLGNVS